MAGWFSRFAVKVSRIAGHYLAFAAAITILLIWLMTGPLFGFSDTWQLVINTSTSIITFLMVFLIQNSQNRDLRAIHFKLDELIHAIDAASDQLIDAEDDTEDELDSLQRSYADLARINREGRKQQATGTAGSTEDITP
ncbi:MAG: low affinity iron permease family protein [Thermomicrobiales bacterium]|nr:low affinity iron permease family protein [Thermomicrobiales bacterium]